MFIYLFIFILGIVSSIINPRHLTLFDKGVFLVFAVVSGFRLNVGTDFNEYVRYFKIVDAGHSSPGEIGFDLIAYIISILGLNSQGMFLVLSSLTLMFLYLGSKYYFTKLTIYKPIFYILFLIFVYFDSFNAVRQVLAAAIIFNGSKYIIEKSFIKYCSWVFIASLFHFTSIVLIPLYFIVNRNFKKVTLIFILIMTLFLSLGNIFTYLMNLAVNRYAFLDLGGYISNYLDSSYNNNEVDYGIVFFINLFILLFIIINKNKFMKSNESIIVFNFYYLYILFFIIALDFFAFSRFQYFFSVYMVVGISSILVMFDQGSRKILKVILLVLYIALYLYVVISGYLDPVGNDNFPYQYNFNIFK
ncbi:EpsG family protein [Salibacterium aidingense]|uniref:EpsG family protein n=1 Tax=Salibacterium aidingense TaxID=384933 RepID=UPI003BDD57A0